MSAESLHTCGCCGRAMDKVQARFDGVEYCAPCYWREFKQTICIGCGKTLRTPGGRGPVLCKRCWIGDRSCVRCGKPTPRASFTTDVGVACASCAKFFKPEMPCSLCGKLSRYVTRDFKAGFAEPTCQNCRNRHNITCASCGKNRPSAGVSDGRPICARCFARQGREFICPACGNPGRPHSLGRCQDCYWRAKARQAIAAGAAGLQQVWAREAYAAFGLRLLEQIPAQRAALRLPRYAAFFARVESLSENPSRITATAIANLLGGKGVLHHRIPLGFLLSEAIIASTAAELSDALEESRHTRVLAAATGTWYGPLLGRFHANMLRLRARFERRGWIGRRSRFALRTISLALAAASLSAAR